MHDIFDLLLNAREISPSTTAMVRAYCDRWKLSGFHGLLRTHIFTEEELADLLSGLLKMDRIFAISADSTGEEARKALTYKLCMEWECLPCLRDERSRQIEIIITDPTQRQRVAYFRDIFSNEFSLAVGARSDVISGINHHFDVSDQLSFLKGDFGG